MAAVHNIPLGVYVPGQSPIHRLTAGIKMLILIVALVAMTVITSIIPAMQGALVGCVFLVACLMCYPLARIPATVARGQLLMPLPMIVFFGALLVWRTGWLSTIATVSTLYATVVLATLLTLTTPVTDMMDALERVLRPLATYGLPVDSIIFAFSLTIRLIPVLFMSAMAIIDAQKARGLTGVGTVMKACGVPLIIRCLLRAKALGEAMISRGVGD